MILLFEGHASLLVVSDGGSEVVKQLVGVVCKVVSPLLQIGQHLPLVVDLRC